MEQLVRRVEEFDGAPKLDPKPFHSGLRPPPRTPIESRTRMKSELLYFASIMVMEVMPPATVASSDASASRRLSSEVAERSGVAMVAVN